MENIFITESSSLFGELEIFVRSPMMLLNDNKIILTDMFTHSFTLDSTLSYWLPVNVDCLV